MTDVTEFTTQADDQAFISSEVDAGANDINDAIAAAPALAGRGVNTSAICNATVLIDSVSTPRSVTITYAGNNCVGNRSRYGTIKATFASGTRWKEAGAVLSVTITNLKITRLSDNRSITLNGTETITNVSGGLLVNLSSLGSITHTIAGNLNITFDDGSQRTWQTAKKRIFTYSNGLVITTSGNGTNGASEWGTNRKGNSFTTTIVDPLVVRQDCSFRITSGKVKHDRLGTTIVTFGLNASGVATSCPGTGSYYMKVEWTGPAGATFSGIYSY